MITLYDLDKRGISDVEVVETAEKSNRIILTLDLDLGIFTISQSRARQTS